MISTKALQVQVVAVCILYAVCIQTPFSFFVIRRDLIQMELVKLSRRAVWILHSVVIHSFLSLIFSGMCALSRTYMQFVCGLLHFLLSRCRTAICFMSFALCYVLINCFIFFIIRFMFVFLFSMLCFLFCVFCVFVLFYVLILPMYIVYFLLVYNFTDHCHRLETQLKLINIVSYIYILLRVLRFHTIDLSHITSNRPTFAMFVTRK